MTATCPAGHTSATSDYCDQCGAKIDGPAAGATVPAPDPTPAPPAAGAGEATAPYAVVAPPGTPVCPVCTTPRSGQDRFCEGCGYDFDAPTPSPTVPGAAQWEVVATADRAYFDRVAPSEVTFPPHCPSRTFTLSAAQTRIGRHSDSRGIAPEIDLSGAPEDTAISHLHALLLRQADGTYSLVDPGSTNGTTVNDDPTPLGTNVPVALADGDRIHLGAWTTLTLHVRP